MKIQVNHADEIKKKNQNYKCNDEFKKKLIKGLIIKIKDWNIES